MCKSHVFFYIYSEQIVKKERHFVLYSSTYIRVIKIVFQQLITRFKNKVSPLRVGRGLFFKDV